MGQKVKRCFGSYGNHDGCCIMCNNYDKCLKCYWGWYQKNKDRRCSLSNDIRAIMKSNKMEFEKERKWDRR